MARRERGVEAAAGDGGHAASRARSRSTGSGPAPRQTAFGDVIKALQQGLSERQGQLQAGRQQPADRARDGDRRRPSARHGRHRPAGLRQAARAAGPPEADHVREVGDQRRTSRRRGSSSARSAASCTRSSSRRPTSRCSGTTCPPSRRPASRRRRRGRSCSRTRRRSRRRARRPTRSAAPTAGRSPTCSRTSTCARSAPAKYDALARAQDQVDRPVGDDGAEDDGADHRRLGEPRGRHERARCSTGSTTRSRTRSRRPPKAAMVFEGDFVGGVITSSTKAKAKTGFNAFPFPSITPGPERGRGRDRAATCSSRSATHPAIEAFVKFLATAPAAEAWAKHGGFGTGNKNVPASIYPDAITRATEAPIGQAKSVVFDMSDEQPAVVRRDHRPGRVGHLPEVPEEPEERHRDPEASSRRPRRRRTRRASSALSAGGIAAEPPVAAAPPPAAEPGRLGRYLTGAIFLAPAALRARRVDGLSGRLHDHPQLLRPAAATSARWVGIDNYKTLFTTSTLHDGDQEQRDLGRGRAGVRHRDRPDLRRAHRARALGGRVQDGRLPADGDLRVRDRRDVADHVPAGPEPRRDQRARQGAVGRRSAPPACSRAALAVDARRCSRRRGGPRPEDAAASGRRRAARADRDRARPRCRRARSRRSTPAPKPGDIVGTSGATSSRAAASRAWSSRASSGCPGVTVELRSTTGKTVQTTTIGRRRHVRLHEGRRRARTRPAIGGGDVREAVRRLLVARAEPDHAVAPDRLHLDLGRLRDGRDRRRPRRDAARRARGRAHRRRDRVAGRSAASPCRCSRRC